MCGCVYFDIEVIDIEVVALRDLHVETRRIFQCQVVDFKIRAPLNIKHMRSGTVQRPQFLQPGPFHHPPMVPPAIYSAASAYLYETAV